MISNVDAQMQFFIFRVSTWKYKDLHFALRSNFSEQYVIFFLTIDFRNSKKMNYFCVQFF